MTWFVFANITIGIGINIEEHPTCYFKQNEQANPLMGGAAKTNGAGGGGAGGKRDTQGGTSFPAFDPTSKGLKRHKFLSKVFGSARFPYSTRQSSKDHLLFFFGNQHKNIFTYN